MTRFGWIVIATATMLSNISCSTTPTAPSQNPAISRSAPASNAVVAVGAVTVTAAAASCTIDIGTTTRPLPALHELANWINSSLSASSLTCGQVRSLAAKLQQEVAQLDQQPQNFPAACGASTSLLNELQALVSTGQLATLTFPPPVPGAPTTVLGLAELTNGMFCNAAHG